MNGSQDDRLGVRMAPEETVGQHIHFNQVPYAGKSAGGHQGSVFREEVRIIRRGAVDIGEGGEGVPAEMLPGVGGSDDCTAVCDPQLAQSAQKHVSKQMPLPGVERVVRSGRGWRMPQSVQSVPYWQSGYSAPGPPSSQQPSEA